MKVLVFYASYGGGHLSAAKSIKQYIDENYKDVESELVDCMKYVNHGYEKITTDAYKLMAKSIPWAWGALYKHSEKGLLAVINNNSNNLLAFKLNKKIKDFKPDVVISTHPFATQMIAFLKKHKKCDCKLASVMTDFAPHNQWLVNHEYIDYIFVSHEGMRKEIIDRGISGSKIYATGIPLSNRFLQHFDKNKLKQEFNLSLDKKTILFFGGGEFGLGKDKTISILDSFINNIGDSYQIIVISGKNKKMQDKFDELVKQKNVESSVQVLGYTTHVPELMSISDLVVTKPGGLTITESLASGLPIVAINPIPGQEEENAELLEKNGVACWIRSNENPENTIEELLNNPGELKHMKIRSKIMAKKHSTQDICQIIFG